jgi:hypothetical protein
VNDKKLTDVPKFTYLGSTLSNDAAIDAEVNCRIAKASSTFGRLNDTVWKHSGISSATELKVYRGSGFNNITIWVDRNLVSLYARHSRQLNHF